MTSTERNLDIGEVRRRSGLPVSTLHVWEEHGLIAPVGRVGLRRQYDSGVLERIAMIILFQRGGFSLAEIAGLLYSDAFAGGKVQIRRKLADLQGRRNDLDVAIAGLEHAMACREPSPLECPRFRAMIDDVLPRESG